MGFPISVLSSESIRGLKPTKVLTLKFVYLFYAAWCSDSHTEPTISRTQATLTLLGCLPASNKWLPFLFSRHKQRSAMSMNSAPVRDRVAEACGQVAALIGLDECRAQTTIAVLR